MVLHLSVGSFSTACDFQQVVGILFYPFGSLLSSTYISSDDWMEAQFLLQIQVIYIC